jgi:Baseplate J-like protein
MPDPSPFLRLPNRDGTSQAGRCLTALDPSYVSIDERSLKDLATFVRAYAAELKYFDSQNNEAGNWSPLFGPDPDAMDLNEVVAFMEAPETFSSTEYDLYRRPHFGLLLTFLKLLRHAQADLNRFTRRHLEFYYKDVLRLSPKNGLPDRVHVVVQLVEGQRQFILPSGTLLHAGSDSQGSNLFYRTDRDLLASQAQVASLKTLFAAIKVIDIRKVHREGTEKNEPPSETFLAMTRLALGDPNPGDQLPPYPTPYNRRPDEPLFKELDTLLDFIQNQLFLSLPAFRALMQLKRKVDPPDTGTHDPRWVKVDSILELAGKRRDPNFHLDASETENFDKNLKAAVGLGASGDLKTLFVGLPGVITIYDLNLQYQRYSRSNIDPEVLNRIETIIVEKLRIHLGEPNEFTALMETVEDIYQDWRRVYDLLRAAGREKQRKVPGHQLVAVGSDYLRSYDRGKFQQLVKDTLGALQFPTLSNPPPTDLEDCYTQVQILEHYFYVAAENYCLIRNCLVRQIAQAPDNQLYRIFEEAHKEKVYTRARRDLEEKRRSGGFEAMVKFALGDPFPGDDLPGGKEFLQLDKVNDQQYIRDALFLEPLNFDYIKSVAQKTTPGQQEWNQVYMMLERAQRRKRSWGEPKASIEKWQNLYADVDATHADSGGAKDTVTPQWRTFGEPRRGDSANIGFALCSPLLSLAGGMRTITLRLQFHADQFNRDNRIKAALEKKPFLFLLSAAEKMVEVDAECTIGEGASLIVTIDLDDQAPAVVPLSAGNGPRLPWPLLQILLRDIVEDRETVTKLYPPFRQLLLEKAKLEVSIRGITELYLQNDDAVLDSRKPFEPFGYSPAIGSSLYFAHPELCGKKLDYLDMEIEWMGVPDNLAHYYDSYKSDDRGTPAVRDNTSFKAKLKCHDNHTSIGITDISLFHAEKDQKTGASKVNEIDRIDLTNVAGYGRLENYPRDLQLITETEVLAWSRYWQLELAPPDFQHAAYPIRIAKYAADMAKNAATAGNPPNPPYTPKIKRLAIGYGASIEIDPVPKGSREVDQIYHVEPFGYVPACRADDGTAKKTASWFFLPQYQFEGELYIGLRNAEVPQTIAILFQMAEGSGDPDLEPAPIGWSFLDGDAWRRLDHGNVLSDTTNGLLNSGIITFSLPSARPHTLLPSDLYWIRAALAANSTGVADTVDVQAQAVSATFVDHGNAADHLSRPLAVDSITRLVNPLPEVKAVHQPFSSTDGKAPEHAEQFYTRSSERLRHKNRALTSWDYERLVLEAFPEIYKAKCLSIDSYDRPLQMDQVQIIIIPDIRGKRPFNPFEPKAAVDTLRKIKQFVLSHNTMLASCTVKNPTYLPLMIRIRVRLKSGWIPAYATELLNGALQRFLAPWAYDESAEIILGGRINISRIINFAKECPYVDYVAHIKLYTLDGDVRREVPENSYDITEIPGGGPDVILVSAPKHLIDIISEERYEEQFFVGINYMTVGLDFKIT